MPTSMPKKMAGTKPICVQIRQNPPIRTQPSRNSKKPFTVISQVVTTTIAVAK